MLKQNLWFLGAYLHAGIGISFYDSGIRAHGSLLG
jgi:hypothetical protein